MLSFINWILGIGADLHETAGNSACYTGLAWEICCNFKWLKLVELLKIQDKLSPP